MALTIAEFQRVRESRVKLVPPRPLTFDEFAEMFNEDENVELVDSTVVRKTAAQLEHEDLFGWLHALLWNYVEATGQGITLGSRAAVQIHAYRGRLPDLLFVRWARRSIVKQKGICGAPDLVVEIISPTDKPSDIIALEADYRTIGVREIWLIDLPKKQVKVLRKRRKGYDEKVLTEGALVSDVIEGFWLRVEWLFAVKRPKFLDVLKELLRETERKAKQ
ncbi:MAG: Uma2 family endonuclease [Armatimonadetes bacterium]|nr:Uma2 family endonuclease [Armatimonadota bacterium]MCX7966889.1 Uma2 family endonuclease [Armatimonadota bacterium]MDW8141847.1 Uma2 family endonuclease [Armatimonadota bacterium]